MSLRHRIAGRAGALRRRYPSLRAASKREAVTRYAALLLQQETLMESMVDGRMDERKWRALSEVSRMLIDLGRSLGLVPAAPKAGTEPDALPDEDDWRTYMYPEGDR